MSRWVEGKLLLRNRKIKCDYGYAVSKHKVKECSALAIYAFEEAPEGTAYPPRQMVHLCTRHHNADKRGELNWITIKTSGMYTIEEDVYSQTIYLPTNATRIADLENELAKLKEYIKRGEQ
mgnify:CR=1 FL=1